jgi:hypothetical protein
MSTNSFISNDFGEKISKTMPVKASWITSVQGQHQPLNTLEYSTLAKPDFLLQSVRSRDPRRTSFSAPTHQSSRVCASSFDLSELLSSISVSTEKEDTISLPLSTPTKQNIFRHPNAK